MMSMDDYNDRMISDESTNRGRCQKMHNLLLLTIRTRRDNTYGSYNYGNVNNNIMVMML